MDAKADDATTVYTVMLADDSREFRTFTRTVLETSGRFDVVCETGNGTEAVILAERHRPDLALVDLSMPGLDGLQATSLICRSCPETKVVMLSASGDPDAAARALDLGAFAYLDKAVPPKQLVARLLQTCVA